MRKKDELNKNWLQKTFRVRDEVISLYKFLEFHGVQNNISKDNLFELIANYSIDFLEENNPTFELYEFNGKRSVKGFTLSEKTLERIEHFQKKYKRILKKGESIEVLLYIYAINHLSKREVNKLVKEYFNLKENKVKNDNK